MITLFSIQTALRTLISLEMQFLFRASFPEPFRICLLCQKKWAPPHARFFKALKLACIFILFPTAGLLARAQGFSLL